jgi:hypothetical protein
MLISPISLLIASVINFFLAIFVYFLVKKLAVRSKHPKAAAWCAVVAWYLLPLPFLGHEFSKSRLPTDEYMINNFTQNREAFEHLVKLYREEYLLNDTSKSWDYLPETKATKDNLGIWDLAYRSDMVWFENPYSPESAKAKFEKMKSGLIEYNLRDRRLLSVVVDMKGGLNFPLKKSYLNLPMEPKIIDGKLLYPLGHLPEKFPQGFLVVTDSLDNYQNRLMRGDCAVKRIDKFWFLQLCKA